MKKKVLSLLLVLCMVMGMLPGLAIPTKADVFGDIIYECTLHVTCCEDSSHSPSVISTKTSSYSDGKLVLTYNISQLQCMGCRYTIDWNIENNYTFTASFSDDCAEYAESEHNIIVSNLSSRPMVDMYVTVERWRAGSEYYMHIWENNNGTHTCTNGCNATENCDFGGKSPTCTEGVKCVYCGYGKAATGHSLSKTEAKNADCINDGNSVYWTCSKCGKYFSDAAGTTEIEKDSWVIKATNHTWGEVTYTWTDAQDNAGGYDKCTATRVCGNDGDHKETETVSSTASVTQEKSCTLPELTTYTATFTGAAFAQQTKANVQTAPATGHSYGNDWGSDGTHHWHECACGDKKDAAEHTYDNACDTDCNVCGKVRTITHAYTEVYGDTEHWMECSVCHDKKDVEKHSFDNDLDSTCNGCSFTRTVTYAIIAGNEQTVTKGNSASFTSNADFSKLLRVEVDGKTVDSSNYTAEDGSTKVTLKAAYIETLSAGEHTLTIVSNDGLACTTFTVKNKPAPAAPDVPQTGDNEIPGLWIALLFISSMGIATTTVYSRKKRRVR